MEINIVYVARFPFEIYRTQFKTPDFTSSLIANNPIPFNECFTQEEWVRKFGGAK